MATIITNKYGLPESIVRAVMVDKHVTKGDISVTTLIDAPQIRQLKFQTDIKEDAMDRIWALWGTAVHHIIEISEVSKYEAQRLMGAYSVLVELGEEKAAKYIMNLAKEKFPDGFDDDIFSEKTLTIEIDGMAISGTMDKFFKRDGILQDYKTCSTWAYIYPESKKKWIAQQNIYAYMLREHGYTVNKAQIVALFRDWSGVGIKRNKDYPKHPVANIDLELYDHETVKEYLKKRVALHRSAELGNIPDCTPKEMWSTGDKFAIKAKGRKNAVKVVDKRSFAEAYIKSNGHKLSEPYIEVRKGENKRCEQFCPVKDICPQRKAYLKELADKSQEI